MLNWLRTRWRVTYDLVRMELTSHLDPVKVFWALFTGTTVGATPMWGLHVGIAILFARIFRLNHALVQLACASVSNPIAGPPLLAFEAALGSWFRGNGFTLPTVDLSGGFEPVLALGWGIVIDLVLGGLAVSPVLGVIWGFGGLALARRWRRQDGG